jgi:SAM-dependent methyltransferase
MTPVSTAPACPAGCTAAPAYAFTVGSFDVRRCPACGTYLLGGAPAARATLDRTQFDDAFRSLRLSNYHRILDDIAERKPLAGARVLDVGSSSGWFLQAAAERGCRCFGIEPDPFFCEGARATLPAGVEVIQGHFPEQVPAAWGLFDVITFHDVFEHLDDPQAVLAACRARFAPGGLLVLSLPSADGFAYRLGTRLYRMGWKSPLERMFQVNYPYPHLFYFTRESLTRLAQRARYEVVRTGRIDGFAVRGSLHRARLDEPDNALQSVAQYATALALVGMALVQRALPADNIYVILRPRDA